jgi:hypothetical protein
MLESDTRAFLCKEEEEVEEEEDDDDRAWALFGLQKKGLGFDFLPQCRMWTIGVELKNRHPNELSMHTYVRVYVHKHCAM